MADPVITGIAEAHGRTPAQVILRGRHRQRAVRHPQVRPGPSG